MISREERLRRRREHYKATYVPRWTRTKCHEPTRRTWYAMLIRADGKVFRDRYFDRGIGVCERWRDYANFLEDMGEKPEGLTLERTDNDKGYSPENCKWATTAEQNRNRRSTLKILHEGVLKCGREVAKEVGIPENTLYKRIKKGMSHDEALTTPVKNKLHILAFQGETRCVKEWAKKLGIGYETLIYRIKSGWSVEKAFLTPVRKLTRQNQTL